MVHFWRNLRPAARFGIVAGIISLKILVLLVFLAALPALFPSTGAVGADWLRALVGPRPVAALESESLALQDAFNRFMAAHGSGGAAISLAQGPAGAGSAAPRARLRSAAPVFSGNAPSASASTDVVTAAPQIGWRPLGTDVNGSPAMAQALLALDPQRPYAAIALVRIDLSKLSVHMMPGYEEPSHAPQVQRAFPGIGVVPAAEQPHLVAAFNGGFKAVNGHYGMMVSGVTLLPPTPGLATLAIYNDGHVALGVWGQDLGPAPDLVAFRQNCPPILANGTINPQVYVNSEAVWGDTIGNKAISWRTAVGLSQDGRYLIYAVGNATTIDTLAQALQRAGAYNAMQLDINRPFAHFVTYARGGSAAALQAVPLLDQMGSVPDLYLVPHYRDFFYLTTH